MGNALLYLGLALSLLMLCIVFPIQLISGNFKPNYLIGLVVWLIIAAGCASELKKRKGRL